MEAEQKGCRWLMWLRWADGLVLVPGQAPQLRADFVRGILCAPVPPCVSSYLLTMLLPLLPAGPGRPHRCPKGRRGRRQGGRGAARARAERQRKGQVRGYAALPHGTRRVEVWVGKLVLDQDGGLKAGVEKCMMTQMRWAVDHTAHPGCLRAEDGVVITTRVEGGSNARLVVMRWAPGYSPGERGGLFRAATLSPFSTPRSFVRAQHLKAPLLLPCRWSAPTSATP